MDLKKLFQRVRRGMFKHRLKPYLVDSKYRVIPAFSLQGTDYWCFDNTYEVPTGRMLAALAIYTELEMRCDRSYLETHCNAMDKLFSDPKKISLTHVIQLNINLKERLNLAPFPDHIYKMASVIFFDKDESLYSYDFEYNKKKIEKWKAAGGTLDFFSRTPLVELIPSLKQQGADSYMYSQVVSQIDQVHRTLLHDLTSEKESTAATTS